MNNILSLLQSLLFQSGFQNAIMSSIVIILLGFFLGKKEIVSSDGSKYLSSILLNISLPALVLSSFIVSIEIERLKSSINIFVMGFVLYAILIFIIKPLYLKYDKDRQVALTISTIFGSTTLFGIPIVTALYGSEGIIYANLFNISYRILLYSYAFMKMSDTSFNIKSLKQVFYNPLVVCTFIGLLTWIFQNQLPQVNIKDASSIVSVSFLRIDKTFPSAFYVLKQLASMSLPIAWLSIGLTLSKVPLKSSFISKDAWFYSFNKVVLLPTITLIILIILNTMGILSLSFISLTVIIVLMSAPSAPVVVIYSIKYNKSPEIISLCSFLSTIISILFIPIWLLVLEYIKLLNIFN